MPSKSFLSRMDNEDAPFHSPFLLAFPCIISPRMVSFSNIAITLLSRNQRFAMTFLVFPPFFESIAPGESPKDFEHKE